MLSTILLQAAAGMGVAKMGATIGAIRRHRCRYRNRIDR